MFKLLKITAALLLFFILMGCRKQANWTSDWIVPLVNDSLVVTDYVNDSTLAINPDNSIQIVAKRNLFSLDLTDMVTIPDTSITQSFQISVNSLLVNPGTTFINQVDDHQFDFGGIVLLESQLNGGFAKVTIENPLPTSGIFTISLPGVTKNGETFTLSKTVEGGSQSAPGKATFTFDFTGYFINLRGQNNDGYNILQTKVSVTTDPNGTQTTITKTDGFNVAISFSNLSVAYAKGYFGTQVYSDTTTINVTQLNSVVGGSINIEELNLNLTLKNGVKVPAKGKITLFESINFNNNTVGLAHPSFDHNLNINPAQGSWEAIVPSELNFAFDENSGNMDAFLENLGSQYKVGYSITVNPLGSASSGNNVIYPKSDIGFYLDANFPLEISADDLMLQDTFAIDFKNNNKQLRIQSGELILHATNSFPYGAKIELILLDEQKNSLTTIHPVGTIQPAPHVAGSEQHTPTNNKISIPINEATASQLAETKHIVITAIFNSTYATNNSVYANAALFFKLLGNFKLKAGI